MIPIAGISQQNCVASSLLCEGACTLHRARTFESLTTCVRATVAARGINAEIIRNRDRYYLVVFSHTGEDRRAAPAERGRSGCACRYRGARLRTVNHISRAVRPHGAGTEPAGHGKDRFQYSEHLPGVYDDSSVAWILVR